MLNGHLISTELLGQSSHNAYLDSNDTCIYAKIHQSLVAHSIDRESRQLTSPDDIVSVS